MIQVTLTVSASQLAQIAAIMDPEIHTTESSARTEQPKTRAAKPKAEPEPEAKAAEPEVKGKTADGEEVAEVPSAEDVTAAAKAYSAKNGRDALVAIVEKYGAKQISGIAEDQRQAFIDEVSA